MPKLFHLSCSPRADAESSAGAKVFVDRFREARPDWDIDVMNLWRDHLPEFEGYVLEAKYARINRRAFTDSQRDAFVVTERIALRIRERPPADAGIFGLQYITLEFRQVIPPQVHHVDIPVRLCLAETVDKNPRAGGGFRVCARRAAQVKEFWHGRTLFIPIL